jgi:hypothetical protein
MEDFTLIHVGKCGGISVRKALSSRDTLYCCVHAAKPDLANLSKRIIFMVRDPVERFVSAFNWRYYLLSTGQRTAAPGDRVSQLKLRFELEFLSCFADVNDFALQLSNDVWKGMYELQYLSGLIGHVNMGFDFYYSELLDNCSSFELAGVICTEHLASDFNRIFGYELEFRENHLYPQRSRFLSTDARINLERLLLNEFSVLDRISELAQKKGVYMSKRYEKNSHSDKSCA